MTFNKSYRNVTITSLIAIIMITSGIGVAYADGAFPGKNIFCHTANNIASGDNSAAFGYSTTSSGANSAAFGISSTASGDNSAAFGYSTTASAYTSTAFGLGTTASGQSSAAFGWYTTAEGDKSNAFGEFNNAKPYSSFVIGRCNEISGTTDSWIDDEPLFVIGNGLVDLSTGTWICTPNNAVTVLKNGNVGIGIANPTNILSIQDSQTPTFSITDTTNTVTTQIYSGNSAGNIGTTTDNDFKIKTNDVTRIMVEKNGNVGIGKTSPNSALDVKGYIELDMSSGIPPKDDCNKTNEVGRMKVDTDLDFLYVCTASGWKISFLN